MLMCLIVYVAKMRSLSDEDMRVSLLRAGFKSRWVIYFQLPNSHRASSGSSYIAGHDSAEGQGCGAPDPYNLV